MKDYIVMQKNIVALMGPIILGGAFIILGMVIMFTADIFWGAIFTFFIIFGMIISIVILVRNYEISKVRIDRKGVHIKEKSGLKLIYWEEFTDCQIIHKGRGIYSVFLLTSKKNYRIIHVIDIVEKLIKYCSAPYFIEILKSQKINS